MIDKNLEAVRLRRTQINAEIARLRTEDTELAIAEQVLLRINAAPVRSGNSSPMTRVVAEVSQLNARRTSARKRSETPKSQKDFVLDALRESSAPWVRSSDIIESVRRAWGVEIPEKSLRPLLSFMKRDGFIVRQGRLVALAERVATRQRAGLQVSG